MLDPRTIRALAARPGDNGRELNLAIAEEGDAHALAALARWPTLEPEVLDAIAARVLQGPPLDLGPEEAPPKIDIAWEPIDEPRPHRPWTLERALLALVVMHPRAPSSAIEAIVARHHEEEGFVLAASLAPNAPSAIVDRVASLPSRSALHERRWLDLLAARADLASLVSGWSRSTDPLLREAAARLASDDALLDALASDPHRRVRRAVALNPSAKHARARLALEDAAIEVRACAMEEPHPRAATGAAKAIARAARAMERGGDLEERAIDAILSHADALDPELAWLAGLVLDLDTLAPVALALAEHDAAAPASRALVAAAMVRPGEGHGSAAQEAASRSNLASLLARAISHSYVPSSTEARSLTGHARLVAFLAELLADTALVDDAALVEGLTYGALVSDPALASRWFALRAARAPGLMSRLSSGLVASVSRGGRPPACALEAAWRETSVDLAELTRLARVVKPRKDSDAHLTRRADGTPRAAQVDLDLDPSLRAAADLTRVIEVVDPWVRLSIRSVLVVLAATPRALAVGGREVRGWREGVVASQLQRVLRAARGAIEVETRVAKLDAHADEAGVAVALLAHTTDARDVAALITRGLRLTDGLFFASIVEALWGLGRRDDVKQLIDALGARRRQDPAMLAAWLVVGDLDRSRPPSVVASALDDPICATAAGPLPAIYHALGIIERRRPGTLERLKASTRQGQAAVVNALARAYPGLVGSS